MTKVDWAMAIVGDFFIACWVVGAQVRPHRFTWTIVFKTDRLPPPIMVIHRDGTKEYNI